jgi:hypothetical protein
MAKTQAKCVAMKEEVSSVWRSLRRNDGGGGRRRLEAGLKLPGKRRRRKAYWLAENGIGRTRHQATPRKILGINMSKGGGGERWLCDAGMRKEIASAASAEKLAAASEMASSLVTPRLRRK